MYFKIAIPPNLKAKFGGIYVLKPTYRSIVYFELKFSKNRTPQYKSRFSLKIE
jgi:hypothetical protein